MENLTPINYMEDYKEIQPSLFKESEVLDTLLKSIFDVCDKQQEDLLWVSQNLLNIDAAEKSQLDFIGNIVGQPRFLSDFNTEPYFGYDGSYQSKTFGSSTDPEIGGYWNSRSYFNTATSRKLNDDEYRRLIKARVIYNQSNCTANDLLEVINLITNSKNNTVQMLKHGLVQINSDDSTGILSYFVDRLLMMDSILPVAAGVRVGLESVAGVLPTIPWYIESHFIDGEFVTISALKQNSQGGLKATITIAPDVNEIGEYLLGGKGILVLDYAMSQLVGESVDWALDPANNRLKYTVPVVSPSSVSSTNRVLYKNKYYYTANDVCSIWANSERMSDVANFNTGDLHQGMWQCLNKREGYYEVAFNILSNPTYNPDAPTSEEKYLPIETVAAQVISNAGSTHTESQEVLKGVVLEGFAAGKHDTSLDAAAVLYLSGVNI